MNQVNSTQETTQSIVPENLSEHDTAFVLMLAKEKVVQKLQQKYIEDMEAKNLEIKQLNQKLQKKAYIEPTYVGTEHASKLIDVDPSFLTKRQNKVFRQGIHFFKPSGESIVRWSLTALSEWLTNDKHATKSTDTKLAKLLERR